MTISITNPSGILGEFRRRASRIHEKSGAAGVLKGIFWFLVYPFYKRTDYYLYESAVRPDYNQNEGRPRVDSQLLHFIIVTSNKQADNLEMEGYSFRRYPTPFNSYLKLYTRWLDYGAIACCTFVDKEFAATNWIIPSQRVQDAIKAAPVKIDYTNQVLTRSIWVNPKFRGMELYRYTIRNRDRYLISRGISISRGPLEVSNSVGKGTVEAMGSRQYGTARALRVLWFKTWKETYLNKK